MQPYGKMILSKNQIIALEFPQIRRLCGKSRGSIKTCNRRNRQIRIAKLRLRNAFSEHVVFITLRGQKPGEFA